MPRAVSLLIALWLLPAVQAQDGKEDSVPAKRYGIEADKVSFPQQSPQDTFASVLKAIERKRIEYLLAQLVDPKFVDDRVYHYKGNFDELVKETSARLASEPDLLRQLTRFFKEGEWKEDKSSATVSLKDVADRQVFFRRIGTRWFMENRVKP
jgi:hypothetical protein